MKNLLREVLVFLDQHCQSGSRLANSAFLDSPEASEFFSSCKKHNWDLEFYGVIQRVYGGMSFTQMITLLAWTGLRFVPVTASPEAVISLAKIKRGKKRIFLGLELLHIGLGKEATFIWVHCLNKTTEELRQELELLNLDALTLLDVESLAATPVGFPSSLQVLVSPASSRDSPFGKRLGIIIGGKEAAMYDAVIPESSLIWIKEDHIHEEGSESSLPPHHLAGRTD